MMITMMKEIMNKISYFYILGDLIVIFISFAMGGYWLFNTQIAFICSMLITFASFHSYKKSITKRVKNSNGEEFREPTDMLEDPYNLFEDEDEYIDGVKKQSNKKNTGVFKYTIKGFASGIGGAINPIRIVAYAVLVASFLYLNRHGVFNAFAFFTGLSIVPIMSMFSSVIGSKN